MTTTFDSPAKLADADLVARSLSGDREAFGQIVTRYQTLVCSLAFNILGNLGESEDAAQETFIVAWKRLRQLREPSRLRAWLCGIVHNRARDRVRRDQREAAAGAEPLEAASGLEAPEALPSERAINQEEQAILWRALCRMPETYREPLILFYRENRSVERVAAALELTTDAVKQRLARGRKLLHQEVIEFVEETLGRSAPGRSFTAGVLTALPAGHGLAGAGTAGVAAKGAAAKSGGMLAAISGSLASLFGVFAGLGAQWLILRATPSPKEKRVKTLWFGAVWAIVLLGWTAQAALRFFAGRFDWSQSTVTLALAINWWLYAVLLAVLAVAAFRWVFEVRRRQAAEAGHPAASPSRGVARGLVMTLLVYGANVYWLVALALRAGDSMAACLVILATVALIVLHFGRLRGKNGDQAMRVHASQVGLTWGLIILTLNLRLPAWLPVLGGPALSPWLLPALTVGLLACVGGALVATRSLGARRPVKL